MPARLVLVAGPGGAGSSEVAARLATHLHRDEQRVALLDLDSYDGARARVSADAADGPVLLSAEPSLSGPGVDLVREVVDLVGLDTRLIDEAVRLPTADLVAALLTLHSAVESGRHDVVVMDAGSRVLDLSAMAHQLPWLLERMLPAQRGWLATARPLMAASMGRRWPGERASRATQAAYARAVLLRDLLADADAVLVVGRGSSKRVDQLRVGLALHEIGVLAHALTDPDADEPDDPTVTAVPVAADHADWDRLLKTSPDRPGTRAVLSQERKDWIWRVPLPLLRSRDVAVRRRSDDLVIEALGIRRVAGLPSSLRRCRTSGATVRQGILEVRFTPDRQERR